MVSILLLNFDAILKVPSAFCCLARHRHAFKPSCSRLLRPPPRDGHFRAIAEAMPGAIIEEYDGAALMMTMLEMILMTSFKHDALESFISTSFHTPFT
jgi:hypothetical protein